MRAATTRRGAIADGRRLFAAAGTTFKTGPTASKGVCFGDRQEVLLSRLATIKVSINKGTRKVTLRSEPTRGRGGQCSRRRKGLLKVKLLPSREEGISRRQAKVLSRRRAIGPVRRQVRAGLVASRISGRTGSLLRAVTGAAALLEGDGRRSGRA